MRDVQARGFKPLLAHPERCPIFQHDPDRLQRLVNSGVLCSITAASMAGGFGTTVRRFTLELLHDGLVHDVASDAHDHLHRPPDLLAGFESAETEIPGIVESGARGSRSPRRSRSSPAARCRRGRTRRRGRPPRAGAGSSAAARRSWTSVLARLHNPLKPGRRPDAEGVPALRRFLLVGLAAAATLAAAPASRVRRRTATRSRSPARAPPRGSSTRSAPGQAGCLRGGRYDEHVRIEPRRRPATEPRRAAQLPRRARRALRPPRRCRTSANFVTVEQPQAERGHALGLRGRRDLLPAAEPDGQRRRRDLPGQRGHQRAQRHLLQPRQRRHAAGSSSAATASTTAAG